MEGPNTAPLAVLALVVSPVLGFLGSWVREKFVANAKREELASSQTLALAQMKETAETRLELRLERQLDFLTKRVEKLEGQVEGLESDLRQANETLLALERERDQLVAQRDLLLQQRDEWLLTRKEMDGRILDLERVIAEQKTLILRLEGRAK